MNCYVYASQGNDYNCLNNCLVTCICFVPILIDRLYSGVSIKYKLIDQILTYVPLDISDNHNRKTPRDHITSYS